MRSWIHVVQIFCLSLLVGGHNPHPNGLGKDRTPVSYAPRRAGRRLQGADWEPLRIHVHADELEQAVSDKEHFRFLKEDVLGAAVRWLSLALRVRPVIGRLQLKQHCNLVQTRTGKCARVDPHFQACSDATIPREHFLDQQYCRGGLSSCEVSQGGAGVDNADFVLYVTAREDYCSGDTVAYASACHQDEDDRPIAGNLNFCRQAEFGRRQTWQLSVGIAIHEIVHALGFASSSFAFFRDDDGRPRTRRDESGRPPWIAEEGGYTADPGTILRGTLDDGTTRKHWVTLPRVVEAARRHFGCETLDRVPLEEAGGEGSAFSHWDQRALNGDMMTPHVHTSPHFSEISLALMEDTGWYKPDYSFAAELHYGRDKGCDFVFGPCIIAGTTAFPDTFCSATDVSRCGHSVSSDTGCTPDHMGKAICTNCIHTQPLPQAFQYFSDPRLGGEQQALAYCPLWTTWQSRSGPSYCASEVAGGVDGLGETYGLASRCILSTVVQWQWIPLDTPQASCRDISCGDDTVRIRIGGEEWLQCHASDEGKQKAAGRPGWSGAIVCPSFSKLCGAAGSGFEGPRVGSPACHFPSIMRNGRCTCAPGFLHADCSVEDAAESRTRYPHGLRYAQKEINMIEGTSLDRSPDVQAWPVRPEVLSGPTHLVYTVYPALPDGLLLDPRDGSLSGVPTRPTVRSPYTICAAGAEGATATTLFMMVDCSGAMAGCSKQAPKTAGSLADMAVARRCDAVGDVDAALALLGATPSSGSSNDGGDSAAGGTGTDADTAPEAGGAAPSPGGSSGGTSSGSGDSEADGGSGTPAISKTPLNLGIVRMVLRDVAFDDIRADPGLASFMSSFVTVMTAASGCGVLVSGVTSLQDQQTRVEFVVSCRDGTFTFLDVVRKIVEELEDSDSALRTSSFGSLYLRSAQLFTVTDAGVMLIYPRPESSSDYVYYVKDMERMVILGVIFVFGISVARVAVGSFGGASHVQDASAESAACVVVHFELATTVLVLLAVSALSMEGRLYELIEAPRGYQQIEAWQDGAFYAAGVLFVASDMFAAFALSCSRPRRKRARDGVREVVARDVTLLVSSLTNALGFFAMGCALVVLWEPITMEQFFSAATSSLSSLLLHVAALLTPLGAVLTTVFAASMWCSAAAEPSVWQSCAAASLKVAAIATVTSTSVGLALNAMPFVNLNDIDFNSPEVRLMIAVWALYVWYLFSAVSMERYFRRESAKAASPSLVASAELPTGRVVTNIRQVSPSRRQSDIDNPVVTPPTVLGAPTRPTVSRDEAVSQMLAMGFDFDASVRVLSQNDWNVSRAVDILGRDGASRV
eukprot:TRINITY_DN32767_c0_g1_i1.p1 TRINITY_DN32767_c0_g1~~TRINITY_DN32767_c0_g1_i1.p1  ORF type:complete len:1319 (+),score=185.65 TRINITY_DN32767_c0_g1_i1:128-4084(+)